MEKSTNSKMSGNTYTDIVISQDFFPTIGGAHLWLYEVYKRWPSRTILLTHDFKADPNLHSKQVQFDLSNHGSLDISRKDIRIDNISLFSRSCLTKYAKIFSHLIRISASERVTFHCIRSFPEAVAAVAYKKFYRPSSKVITYAHGEELLVARTSLQLTLLAKLVYSSSDLIIANSRFTRRLVKDICPKAKITVIHPGVDVNAFHVPEQQRRAYRALWGWPDDTVILATISRMEPRKNQISVIKALGELREEGLPMAYIIGGEGEEMDKLSAEVRELNLTNWVRFTGRLSDKERTLAFCAADVHVLPSLKAGPMIEGFGIVFLEAAAAGIPSIAGNAGGQPEAVLHGRTGLVIDGANLAELKQAIRLLAENVKLREYLGANGRKWAAENDWRSVAQKLVEKCSFEFREFK